MATTGVTTYQPEKVKIFEIGTKNRFAGNTLQFNASAFYYTVFNDADMRSNAYFLGNAAMTYVPAIRKCPPYAVIIGHRKGGVFTFFSRTSPRIIPKLHEQKDTAVRILG